MSKHIDHKVTIMPEGLAAFCTDCKEWIGVKAVGPRYCCRLDQEFICGIVRNRSGIDSGELDYTIRTERADKDLPNVIKEVERLLARLKETV